MPLQCSKPNDILRDMLHRFVFVYFDSILIFSKSRDEHVYYVRTVLQCLLENSLYVKAEKCEFHYSLFSLLGYIVAEGRLQMDPNKASAVNGWSVTENGRQLQGFQGFNNFYRCFI